MILEHISSPADVKALGRDELNRLCGELRDFLVESVARTGGHLASNLGAVELTVALHRLYDTSRDRLIFDVGHQCYVHTGHLALYGGEDGLDFYRAVVSRWKAALTEGGRMYFEVGAGQADAVLRLMRGEGFVDINILPDTQGIGRVVYGTVLAEE